MKRILLIQSRQKSKDIKSEQREYDKTIKGLAKLSFLSVLDTHTPWHKPKKIIARFDAVFIGGSGDFDFDGGEKSSETARIGAVLVRERLTPLIEYLISQDFPTAGICFGHQIIAEIKGGKVRHNKDQAKKGIRTITLTKEGEKDKLLSIFNKNFSARYWHKDSVSTLPAGAVLLATSANCKFSALRYRKNIYTFQFHPERSTDTLIDTLVSVKKLLSGQTKNASLLLPVFIKTIV